MECPGSQAVPSSQLHNEAPFSSFSAPLVPVVGHVVTHSDVIFSRLTSRATSDNVSFTNWPLVLVHSFFLVGLTRPTFIQRASNQSTHLWSSPSEDFHSFHTNLQSFSIPLLIRKSLHLGLHHSIPSSIASSLGLRFFKNTTTFTHLVEYKSQIQRGWSLHQQAL